MKNLSKESVTWHEIDEEDAGQRMDNFLLHHLKGVPKSHVYRILRSGEVRVNSGRVDATYRLKPGDKIRIPPIRIAAKTPVPRINAPRLDNAVLFEDEALIVFNKPAGLAVHGGSGVSFGVIEQLRQERPQSRFLELVHRLDKETSGILLIAKKRSALTALHEAMREGGVEKHYLALVRGKWLNQRQHVKLPLHKYVTESGERRVSVDKEGQEAHTIFTLREAWQDFSLLEAELKTGRTHQIRVHLAHLGFPIAGDDKYGDFPLNKALHKQGLKRMFLHAFKIQFHHPLTGEKMEFTAPLPEDLENFVKLLESAP